MTNYIARHNGKIVGTRTTKSRTYSHAVVVQEIEDVALLTATTPNIETIKQDRRNYAHYVQCATGTYHGTFADGRAFTSEITGDQLARAQAIAAMTIDEYVEQQRLERIARHEARKAEGAFEPGVVTWCGRLDLAQKAVSQFVDGVRVKLVAIVPTEEVTKAKKGA